MIRVFLLDDHGLMRAGYRMILEPQPDIEVVGEASCGEEALPQIRRLKPDVVLCDLHMPGVSGLDITERLVKGQVGSKVVIVSVQVDGPMPQRLLDAGAAGYLGKCCEAAELLKAIREVARGRRYLGAEIAQQLALGAQVALALRPAVAPRDGDLAAVLPGPARRGHRAPAQPERQDRGDPQVPHVRQARHQGHGRARAHGRAARRHRADAGRLKGKGAVRRPFCFASPMAQTIGELRESLSVSIADGALADRRSELARHVIDRLVARSQRGGVVDVRARHRGGIGRVGASGTSAAGAGLATATGAGAGT